ncbi:MAG: hypothetical protein JWQ71_2575 [Pedosphaera sp.]|nr:hypothetical protein [Pedosphaera sp.]
MPLMPRLYQTKLWQLQIPDGWTKEGSNQLITFFRSDGVGILSVSMVEGESPFQNDRAEPFRGRLSGTTWTSNSDINFMRIWTLSCRGRQLLVMYRCAAKNAELELSEVDEILQSMSENGSEAM